MRPVRLIVVLLTCSFSMAATIISVGVTPDHYGNLDQHNTNCPNTGCGPTAAVNSFVFLQNVDPFTYGMSLVPESGGDPLNPMPTQSDESGVANILLGPKYMNTDCTVCGTYWGRFILGQEKYIETKQPGVTDYKAQSSFTWDPNQAGTPAKPIAKPDDVQDNTIPTIDFLLNEVAAGEDVEILLQCPDVSPCPAGHYLTVTGLTWDTDEMTGTLSFIDPSTGKPDTKDISQAAGEPIFIDYPGGLSNIDVAISESPKILPSPEPATLAFALLGGVAGLICLRRTRGASATGCR